MNIKAAKPYFIDNRFTINDQLDGVGFWLKRDANTGLKKETEILSLQVMYT